MRIPSKYFIFYITLLLTACSGVTQKDLKHLAGYWEISEVSAHGEIFSPRGSAPAVDFYQLKTDRSGIKKKLVPSFGNKYSSSKDLVQFNIIETDHGFALQFNSALEQWEEEIKAINPEELVLFHNEKSYHYKRHQKITF